MLRDFLKTIRDLKWDVDEEPIFTSTLPPFENAEEREAPENLVVIEEKTTLICKPGSVLTDSLCGKILLINYTYDINKNVFHDDSWYNRPRIIQKYFNSFIF